MAGDLIFNDATIEVKVEALNIYGNPAEVTQRLDQIAAGNQSLQTQGVQIMATGQELLDGINDLGAQIDAFQSAANNAESRITAAIKAGQTGAALQTVVDTAFAKVRDLGSKAKSAADDLNDGTDEADTPPDTGGGTTPPDDGTGTGGGTPPDDGTGGGTPPADDTSGTLPASLGRIR